MAILKKNKHYIVLVYYLYYCICVFIRHVKLPTQSQMFFVCIFIIKICFMFIIHY